jgi:membrane protein
VVALLGLVADVNPDGANGTSEALGLRGVLAQAVAESASQGGAAQVGLLLFAAGAAAYAAAKVVRVVRASHAAIWSVEPRPMNLPRATGAFIALATAALAIPSLAAWLRSEEIFAGIMVTILVFVAYFWMWLVASAALPHGGRSRRALFPGAVMVALGAQVLHVVTIVFLASKAERANSVYGALGIAVVTLAWLFIIARLILGSAVVNAVILDRKARARRARGALDEGSAATEGMRTAAGSRRPLREGGEGGHET